MNAADLMAARDFVMDDRWGRASRHAVTALPDANPLYWRNCAGVPA
jgi:hypothetical protein